MPPGWITVERVKSGVLVYGLCFTILTKDPSNYEALVGMYAKDSHKNAPKMEQVLECMSGDGDDV